MRIFVRVPEEHRASSPSPASAVPFGPSVAHPSLATAVQARYAVAPRALHDQPFSARTETQSGQAAQRSWRCRAALGWRMLAERPSPCAQGWLLPPPAMPEQPLRHCPESWKKGKNIPARRKSQRFRKCRALFYSTSRITSR